MNKFTKEEILDLIIIYSQQNYLLGDKLLLDTLIEITNN
jgi:hypothetical protein